MFFHLKTNAMSQHFTNGWRRIVFPPRRSMKVALIQCILLFFFFWVAAVPIKLYAQEKITGKVTDENAQPLPGVSVKVKGGGAAAMTGTDGSFSISVKRGQVLEFTYVGKVSQELTVGSNSVINVALKEGNSSNLNEVVVTGYMTQRKADLTGAISVVPTEALNKNHGTTNVLEALQGWCRVCI
jgi:hypothetical protein